MKPLARKRTILGLTAEQLAKRLGVAQATISSWESGKSMPRPKQLIALAKALRVTPDEAMKLIEDSRPEEASV